MNDRLTALKQQMNRYFVGKPELVDNVLTCFLAGGHLLLEDVPGVGKTTLAGTFAASCGLSFGRIQFTPDTMPGDVTGLSVYDMKTGEFKFRPGAVMKNIVLADELNRTSPKTQSALLEAMAEAQVTVDGTVYPLPDTFMVIATQNPASFTGTFPLPEAQLDRFMMKLSIGYPSKEDELGLARMFLKDTKVENLKSVCEMDDVLKLQDMVKAVTVKENVIEYVHNIITATREEKKFMTGASPRAMLALIRAAQANALMDGRDYVKPDDIKQLYVPVCRSQNVA